MKSAEEIEKLQFYLLAAFEGAERTKNKEASASVTKLMEILEWVMDESKGTNSILNYISSLKSEQMKGQFYSDEQLKTRYTPVIKRFRELA